MPQLNEQLLEHLLEIASAAGRAIMPHYDNPKVHRKEDGSPLTAADLAADSLIEDELSRLFPGVAQVSEERVDQVQMGQLQGGDFFLIDPLDGTRMFLNRNGQFTVNIALIRPAENYPHAGRPVAGVVHAPVTGESWVGVVGLGAWKVTGNVRTPLFANPTGSAEGLVVAASHDEGFSTLRDLLNNAQVSPENGALRRMLDGGRIGRRIHIGSSLKFCHIAEGLADVYPRTVPCMEWDTAAGHAVLLAAGGNVVQASGPDLVYGSPGFRTPQFIAHGRGNRT